MRPPPLPRAWLHMQLAAIRRRWWLIPATMLAALLLALIYLRNAQYVYTATLYVHTAPSSSGARPTSLGGLAALAGLGGMSEQVSPFRFYLDGLTSTEVSARLARNDGLMHRLFPAQWDARTRQWRQPSSLAGSIRRGVTGMLGLPQFGWQPPGAAELQDYIRRKVQVHQSVKTPIVDIAFDTVDPQLGVAFLGLLHATTDTYLREQQSRRTRANITYLSAKLREVTLDEQRKDLVTALAAQERQSMLVNSAAPYAAEPFDMPTASPEPTRPRAIVVLIGTTVAGLVIGVVLAAILGGRALRRRLSGSAIA